jgi:hypothetical protein
MFKINSSSIALGTGCVCEACTGGLEVAGRHRYSVRMVREAEGVLGTAQNEMSSRQRVPKPRPSFGGSGLRRKSQGFRPLLRRRAWTVFPRDNTE